MIVFTPKTETTLTISINTKEDANLLGALAVCAGNYLSKQERYNPRVQFIQLDGSVEYKELDYLIEDILRLVNYYAKEFPKEK